MRPQTATHPHSPSVGRAIAASLVFIAMLLAALSLWTMIPLSWIYIGSKVSETQFPSGGPYAVVGVGIIVTILLDAWLIGRLSVLYERITGTDRLSPMRPSWLKSSRDTATTSSTTIVEAVLVGSVLLAGVVFLAWFFLLAGSPIAKP